MVMRYDKIYDILYITLSDQDAYGHEEPDGFVTHRSMVTDEITGFTLFNASEALKSMWRVMGIVSYGKQEDSNGEDN